MKERVYLETSVVSYLTGRLSTDTIVAAHQHLTRDWWEAHAPSFDLLISELVYQEAAAGHPEAARLRLAILAELPLLAVTDATVTLAEHLIARGPIPAEFAADALHIAIAAVHGIDYLVTWNCKHLANATLRSRIEALVESAGYACPVICTPEELLEA